MFFGATTEIGSVPRDEVQLMDVSPKQIVSVGTALIPFLEHDDANRALMGANMQKQAVPLVKAEAPYIGTGVEAAPRAAADICMALGNGTVTEVDGDHVTVEYDEKVLDVDGRRIGRKVYHLLKFERSNQDTCINQKPVVREGDKVKQGDILANGPSTDNGELALGKNLLVAFMPWEGYNFEDAIILSERMVRDDVLTSIHIHEHEVDARDTKLGPEEITRDIPNLSEEILADLDERGSSASAPRWAPATCWSARSRPRARPSSPPRSACSAPSSVRRPARSATPPQGAHGEEGKVIDVKVQNRDDGHELRRV